MKFAVLRYIPFILFLLTAVCSDTRAQPPIGQWREHLPWNTGIGVAAANNRIYCATSNALMYVDLDDRSLHRLSRVNGLAETGISLLAKNETTGRLIIAYQNSNLELVERNTIRNISDIKRKTISGDKTVYRVFSKNNFSYICCGFGIVVINEDRRETADTWYIGATGNFTPVYGLTEHEGFFYAATAEGVKRAPVSGVNLADYRNWTVISGVNGLPTGVANDVLKNGTVLLVRKNDTLFSFQNNTWQIYYQPAAQIISVHFSENKLLVCEQAVTGGRITQLNAQGNIDAVYRSNNLPEAPRQAILNNNTLWVADFFKGLYEVENNNFALVVPNGPPGTASGEMMFARNGIWAAAGNVNDAWNYTYNANGVYYFNSDNNWQVNWRFNIPAMDSMLDFITIAARETDGTVFMGSYGGGLLQLNPDNTVRVFKRNSTLQPAIGDPGSFRVSGLATDINNNLWVSNYGAPQGLHVQKPDGTWKGFNIPFFLNDGAVAQILVDDFDQKWIVSPKANGLLCFNHGASVDNTADDKWKLFQTGAANGNLPENNVYCVAKDKDGVLWVGTANGIALIACAGDVFNTQGCAAVLPVVQQDRFAGFLFQNETVQTIAVDGANRKWVGTKNGVWLISAGGEKVIHRFSEENSPLLSNDVKRIFIHPKTGEVFFSTFRGICSFRGSATEPAENHNNVLVFPNPVPPGYNGQIAIRGLAAESIVKITELDGRLVYQTKALGGQAIWNGLNYRGQKISSGAYLVLVTSENNNEKVAAKIFFIAQ